MPPGLREATAFAARLFAALLPAPGASTVAVTGCGAASAASKSAAAKSAAARSLAKGVYSALLPSLGGWLGRAAAAKGAATAASAAAAAAAEAVEADVRLACRVVSAAVLGSQAAGGLVMLIILSLRPRLTHHRPSTAMRWALGLVTMAAARAWACMARGDWNEVTLEDVLRRDCSSSAAVRRGDIGALLLAGGGNKALLDSGVFRSLVVLFASQRFPDMDELRCLTLQMHDTIRVHSYCMSCQSLQLSA